MQTTLFQRAKLQKNESQSQPKEREYEKAKDCFKEQNYKKMKANHNRCDINSKNSSTVSKSKITKK